MAMDNTNYKIYAPKKSAFQYLINEAQLEDFFSKLTDGTLTGFSITGLFQNTNDYVVSVIYYPILLTSLCTYGTVENITIGKESANIQAYPVTEQKQYIQLGTFTVSRALHNYLDYAPYTKITLEIPYFEPIDLEPRYVYGHTNYIYFAFDMASGHATIYIYDGSKIIASKSAQLGIVVPMGKTNEQEQQRNNILQAISVIGSIGTLAYGGATGNGLAIAGGIALTSKTAVTTIQNNVDTIKGYTGMQGNRDGLCVEKTIRLIVEKPIVVSEPDINLKGKPSMINTALSNLEGYTEVGTIHFDPKGNKIYQDEISEIVALLKGGVVL